jgi:LPXTG-motif cell wall-anchored protein
VAKIQNNSMAMVGTVALVGVFASIIGLFDPSTCVDVQTEGWTSCESIARDRQIGSWILLGLSVLGFAASLVRRKKRK